MALQVEQQEMLYKMKAARDARQRKVAESQRGLKIVYLLDDPVNDDCIPQLKETDDKKPKFPENNRKKFNAGLLQDDRNLHREDDQVRQEEVVQARSIALAEAQIERPCPCGPSGIDDKGIA